MKHLQKYRLALRQSVPLLIVGQFLMFLVLPLFVPGTASAGQLTARSIQMSDSTPGGINEAYKITFTPSANAALGGVVIDFCSNSALAGDTCTAPTGFNVNRGTTAVQTGQSAGCGTGTLATYTSDTTNNRIIVTRGTGNSTSGVCSFDLGNDTTNGFTNPTTLGTFYGRIYTYGTNTAAQGHNTGTPTGYTDFGAVAISTANTINITARVQESLIFCTAPTAPTANCGGAAAAALTLGHGGGGKNIDSSQVDSASAFTQISTNAVSGATVRIKNQYACGGLSMNGGTSCGIPAHTGAATASAMAAGTAAFGIGATPGTPLSGGAGSTVIDGNYYNASFPTYAATNPTGYFGMDTTTATNNVASGYGDPLYTTNGTVASNVNTQVYFAATASNVTPAGLYQANIAFIATGIF
jgi:hypothetical protein